MQLLCIQRFWKKHKKADKGSCYFKLMADASVTVSMAQELISQSGLLSDMLDTGDGDIDEYCQKTKADSELLPLPLISFKTPVRTRYIWQKLVAFMTAFEPGTWQEIPKPLGLEGYGAIDESYRSFIEGISQEDLPDLFHA